MSKERLVILIERLGSQDKIEVHNAPNVKKIDSNYYLISVTPSGIPTDRVYCDVLNDLEGTIKNLEAKNGDLPVRVELHYDVYIPERREHTKEPTSGPEDDIPF